MPHYFVDIFDGVVALDVEGQELPDRAAVRRLVRTSLAAMMRDEERDQSCVRMRAEVRDETGDRIMVATLVLTIEEAEEDAR